MASITSLKASDGSGNASVATVQSVRSPLATTLVVDTVQGINTKFHATMGTPHTFVDPVTNETITVISEASAVDFQGHVDGGNLEIDTIAPGFTDNGSAVSDIVMIKPTTQWADEVAKVLEATHNDDGTLKTDSVDSTQIKANAVTTPKLAPGSVTVDKTDFPVSVEGNSSCTVVVPPSKKVAIWVQARDYDSASTLNLAASGANTVSNLLDGVYSDQVNQTVVGIRLYTFTNEGSTTLTLTGNSGGLSNTKIIAIPMLS